MTVAVHAHRGIPKRFPENTLLSFKEALKYKPEYIELDIHQCKTGELVVIHDYSVNRTTYNKGIIEELTLEKIKTLKIRGKHREQRIPTLEEVIHLVKGKCKLNIEIKSQVLSKTLLLELIHVLQKTRMTKHVVVSSFNLEMLAKLKSMNKNIETAALFIEKKSPTVILRRLHYVGTFIKKAKNVNASALNLPHQFITKKLIKHAYSNNLKVNAWTCNSKKSIEKMKLLGVDGIITNHPEKFTTI
jgi:glycerophosphoryl diester phosphodiesterase